MPRAGGVGQESVRQIATEWSGAILVNTRGEMLLNLRDGTKTHYPNQWDLIGGTLEPGESPGECMLREIYEETGESLQAIESVCDFDIALEGEASSRLHLFVGKLDKTAAELMVGEGLQHRFFSVQDLESFDIVPQTKAALLEFVAGGASALRTRAAPAVLGPTPR